MSVCGKYQLPSHSEMKWPESMIDRILHCGEIKKEFRSVAGILNLWKIPNKESMDGEYNTL
jgi:hypothetical protein